MAGRVGYQWDLLLVVTNDRYGSELFGTVRRLIDAALDGGHSIQVWACGCSNTLTECPPGRPGDASCGESSEPSTAGLIGSLVQRYPDRFSWVACRTCSDGRGGADHIPGVLTEPSFANFHHYVGNAAKTIYVGGT